MHAAAVTAALLAALALPLAAAETEWQQVAPDARLRLISTGEAAPGGGTLVGIEIDMPETTKTYWRVPGESGIPLMLDAAGSRGVAGYEVHWPMPLRERVNGYVDHVYYGPTVLPVAVAASGDDPHLRLAVRLGICSEVCVPVEADFELPLADGPDTASRLRIAQALAEAPIPWDEDDGPVAAFAFSEDERALVARLAWDDIDLDTLIADAGDPALLFGVPQKHPIDGLVRFPLLGWSGQNGVEGRPIRFTFATESGPYDIVRIPVPLSELVPAVDDRAASRRMRGEGRGTAGMVERGDRVPSVTVKLVAGDGVSDADSAEVLGSGTVVLFAVPGAFTPTCHANHLPGFVAGAGKIAEAGADRIVCAAANDHHVVKAWAEASGALGAISFIADGNAELARAFGLDRDMSPGGMGVRWRRAAMILRDGVVDELFVETEPGVGPTGAPAVLTALQKAHG